MIKLINGLVGCTIAFISFLGASVSAMDSSEHTGEAVEQTSQVSTPTEMKEQKLDGLKRCAAAAQRVSDRAVNNALDKATAARLKVESAKISLLDAEATGNAEEIEKASKVVADAVAEAEEAERRVQSAIQLSSRAIARAGARVRQFQQK